MKEIRVTLICLIFEITNAFVKTNKKVGISNFNYYREYENNFSNPNFYKELNIDLFVIITCILLFVIYQNFFNSKNV